MCFFLFYDYFQVLHFNAKLHLCHTNSPNKLNFIFSLQLRLTHLSAVDIKVVYSEEPLTLLALHSGGNDTLSRPQMELITWEN